MSCLKFNLSEWPSLTKTRSQSIQKILGKIDSDMLLSVAVAHFHIILLFQQMKTPNQQMWQVARPVARQKQAARIYTSGSS